MNYDQLFLEYVNRCIPSPTVFTMPSGWAVMTERFSCPFCRETLWLIAGADGIIRSVQTFGWFGYPQVVKTHTNEICRQMCLDMNAVREYERWVCEHQSQEDEVA